MNILLLQLRQIIIHFNEMHCLNTCICQNLWRHREGCWLNTTLMEFWVSMLEDDVESVHEVVSTLDHGQVEELLDCLGDEAIRRPSAKT